MWIKKLGQYALLIAIVASLFPLTSQAQDDTYYLELTLIQTLEHPIFVEEGEVKHANWVEGVSWSPDGKYLVSVNDAGFIYIWNSTTWESVTSLDCGNRGFSDIFAWYLNQSTLWVGCEGFGEGLQRVPINNDLTLMILDTPYQALQWSADGSRLAVAQEDETVGIWNASLQLLYSLGQPIDRYLGMTECCLLFTGLRWSPSGRYLAVMSRAHGWGAELWDLQVRQKILDVGGAFDFIWEDAEQFWIPEWDILQYGVISSSEVSIAQTLPIPYNYTVWGADDRAYLVSCDYTDRYISIYDVEVNAPLELRFTDPNQENIPCYSQYTEMAWSSRGMWAVPIEDGKIQIWQAGSAIPRNSRYD